MDFRQYSEEFRIVAIEKGYSDVEISYMLTYASKLTKKGLPIIFDQFHLSLLVGYDYYFLLAISNCQYRFYKHFEIPKKNGKMRKIEEPSPALKEIQTWILKNILVPASKKYVSPVAKAFIPGKKLKENARFHKSKRIVVALDIIDFFGSVCFSQVFWMFRDLGYNKGVSMMLTNICMLSGSLPQGAPSSPMLSNLIFQKIDNRLFQYCRNRNIMYSRYADDLTFSSKVLDVRHLISYVKMLLSNTNFRINEEKTKVMARGMRQIVTGVVVNDKLQVPKQYRDKVRQEMYYGMKYGFDNHIKRIELPEWCKTTEVYIHHLWGKVNHVLNINPNDKEFKKYAEYLKSIYNPVK